MPEHLPIIFLSSAVIMFCGGQIFRINSKSRLDDFHEKMDRLDGLYKQHSMWRERSMRRYQDPIDKASAEKACKDLLNEINKVNRELYPNDYSDEDDDEDDEEYEEIE